MDYEKLYKEALERARECMKDGGISQNTIDYLCDIFPELKESEDERIRKRIYNYINVTLDDNEYAEKEKWLSWLEKQDKKLRGKSVLETTKEEKIEDGNKVESKFHEGDWITFYGGKPFKMLKIEEESSGILDYLLVSQDGYDSFYNKKDVDENARLWTIADAKPGDVLASKDGDDILIFRNLDTAINFSSYYNLRGKGELGWSNKSFIPAIKEQRDTLMKAMADDGYTFDFEKKELSKVEEEVNGEDYGIDGLYHAQKILERTLGKVDGYQSDDGILEHKCAISAVKKLYEML